MTENYTNRGVKSSNPSAVNGILPGRQNPTLINESGIDSSANGHNIDKTLGGSDSYSSDRVPVAEDGERTSVREASSNECQENQVQAKEAHVKEADAGTVEDSATTLNNDEDKQSDCDSSSCCSSEPFSEFNEEAFYAEGVPNESNFQDGPENRGNDLRDQNEINRSLEMMWPSPDFPSHAHLSQGEAEELIAAGAPVYVGYVLDDSHCHGGQLYYADYLETEIHSCEISDVLPTFSYTLGASDSGNVNRSWHTLEYPSMLTAFGPTPGTTTMSHWVSTSTNSRSNVFEKNANLLLNRQLELKVLASMLHHAQHDIQSSPSHRRSNLYGFLLLCLPAYKTPRSRLFLIGQIFDLMRALNNRRPSIYFYKVAKHNIGHYILQSHESVMRAFFRQLVAAVELYNRIKELPRDQTVSKLVATSSLQVAYTFALADLWIKNVTWSPLREGERPWPEDPAWGPPEGDMDVSINNRKTYSYMFKNMDTQLRRLYDFAAALEWPFMTELELRIGATSKSFFRNLSSAWTAPCLSLRNPLVWTWLSGVVLPGEATSFFLMGTLAASLCDLEIALISLNKMNPHSGFQFAGRTFWLHTTIVGKVLGALPDALEHSGWITGPHATFLKDSELIFVHQEDTPHLLSSNKILTMQTTSAPLGPGRFSYPVKEYYMPKMLTPTAMKPATPVKFLYLDLDPEEESEEDLDEPSAYLPRNALLRAFFEVDGNTISYRLIYNVEFVATTRCHFNPHPLYHEHELEHVVAWQLMDIKGWSNPLNSSRRSLSGEPNMERACRDTPRTSELNEEHGYSLMRLPAVQENLCPLSADEMAEHNRAERTERAEEAQTNICEDFDDEITPSHYPCILAIECLTNLEEEALARAWCAQYGLSAIICNLQKTCLSCATRMATAICIGVVIVTDKYRDEKTRKWKVGDGEGGVLVEEIDGWDPEMPASLKEETIALWKAAGRKLKVTRLNMVRGPPGAENRE